MPTITEELKAQRDNVRAETERLREVKLEIIRSIRDLKQDKERCKKQTQVLIEEQAKVSGEYQKAKAKVVAELNKIEERANEVREAQNKDYENIAKQQEEVKALKEEIEKNQKADENKLIKAKKQLREELSSLSGTLDRTFAEILNSLKGTIERLS